ncbi:MAG: hypothetical protein ACK41S_10190 [Planctomycetota bacterium]
MPRELVTTGGLLVHAIQQSILDIPMTQLVTVGVICGRIRV